jgi:hypothetical protein
LYLRKVYNEEENPANVYKDMKWRGRSWESNYSMLHDIYSLGVVLLEIGLGKSFSTGKNNIAAFVRVPGDWSCRHSYASIDRTNKMLDMAKKDLKQTMGEIYIATSRCHA